MKSDAMGQGADVESFHLSGYGFISPRPRLNNFSPRDYSPSIGWKIAAVKAGKAAALARAN